MSILEISSGQVGLYLQIIGVLAVFLTQVWFGIRAWRRFGDMKRAFMGWIGPVRMDAGDTRGKTDEYLKKTFPELWAIASYLREDVWITAIGLFITLIGLICELLNLTLTFII